MVEVPTSSQRRISRRCIPRDVSRAAIDRFRAPSFNPTDRRAISGGSAAQRRCRNAALIARHWMEFSQTSHHRRVATDRRLGYDPSEKLVTSLDAISRQASSSRPCSQSDILAQQVFATQVVTRSSVSSVSMCHRLA